MSEKKVYFNKPQRLTQLIGANTTVIVAGRRTGKTDSIAAPVCSAQYAAYARLNRRHRGADLQTRIDKYNPRHARPMEAMGLHRGHHYVVGRMPLKSFRLPIIDQKDYEHVISFYNGSVAVFISQDRSGSSSSMLLKQG